MVTQVKKIGSVFVTPGTVQIWSDDVGDEINRATLKAVVGALEYDCRMVMRIDQYIKKRYKTLSQDHFEGFNGELKVNAQRSGCHAGIEFFVEPRYPGYSWDRMSPYQRRLVMVHARRLVLTAIRLGYEFQDRRHNHHVATDPTHLAIRDGMLCPQLSDPLDQFNATWGKDRFKRDESGWPCESEYLLPCWVNQDNECARVGTIVYVVHNGRLLRGKAYPNMNGSWRVETGAGDVWFKRMTTDPDVPTRPTRDQSNHRKRLTEELEKAIKEKLYKRVAQIATVLEREPSTQGAES
jgi:hypothetical protein